MKDHLKSILGYVSTMIASYRNRKYIILTISTVVATIAISSVIGMYIIFLLLDSYIIEPMQDNLTAVSYQSLEMEKEKNEIEHNRDSLLVVIDSLKTPIVFNVIVTAYHPVVAQCDDTPDILADNTKIDISRASEYRYVAVSYDQHIRYGGTLNFGDLVMIVDTGWVTCGLRGHNHTHAEFALTKVCKITEFERPLYVRDSVDGVYTVKDLMNPRWKMKVDILITPGTKPYQFKEAKMMKIEIPTIT